MIIRRIKFKNVKIGRVFWFTKSGAQLRPLCRWKKLNKGSASDPTEMGYYNIFIKDNPWVWVRSK